MKKKRPNLDEFLVDNPLMIPKEVSRITGWSVRAVRDHRKKLGLRPFASTGRQGELPAAQQADFDEKLDSLKEVKTSTDRKYKEAIKTIQRLRKERDAVVKLKEVMFHKLKPRKDSGSGAIAVALASDWHYEELVEPETVNGLNEFNLEVADSRIKLFFQNLLKLIQAKRGAVEIDTLVLALLGDFINGSIHDELMEGNQLMPIEALIAVQNHLASGIKFLLDKTDLNLVIPCHSGNHGRATARQRIATERGNSFEYYMYHQLSNEFQGNKRVSFIISKGYHSYVDLGGFIIRFHHGHQMRYFGGVGGLFIPVRKSISQWNKARHADLDCFGHFHQSKFDTGNFVCNGSLVGFNPFAISIKGDYEPPAQTFFLVNTRRRQVGDYCPIWLD